MSQDTSTIIVIAHYGLERKVTEEECKVALNPQKNESIVFVDFEAGNSKLGELYSLPFENMALMQQRKFAQLLKPVLEKYPDSTIAYFGLTPIPIGFHLGVLVGNTHPYIIFQWHHSKKIWFRDIDPPSQDYEFKIKALELPTEIQKGKGDITVRISTSYSVDEKSTYAVVPNPANEFDLSLEQPHVDSLYSQEKIKHVVDAFQTILDTYANKLRDREKIHLFISSSSGLPFAIGTRINPNICPFIQTYQYSRQESPNHREAILISKDTDRRPALLEDERRIANAIRVSWENEMQRRLKPFIQIIAEKKHSNWIESICTEDQYKKIANSIKYSWDKVPSISGTSLKTDHIDLSVIDVEDGFEYIEKTNSWLLDDGFLAGLSKRLTKNTNTDIAQAGRLFFFHEALHYSKNGHNLTKEVADGIGQFPKVIEEADYQADVWALLTEYKFCQVYVPDKLENGIKQFFCNAIETAVETMWSFMENGSELNMVQVRSMNRFLNWYWQWLRIENLDGQGSVEEVICILFDKPIIEFAGAPMDLRAHRTFFKLDAKGGQSLELATFVRNRVHRSTPTAIGEIVSGFKQLNGEKIKYGLKSFQQAIGLDSKQPE